MKGEYFESKGDPFPRFQIKITRLFKVLGGILILILIYEALGVLVGNLTAKPVVARWDTIEKGCWTEALFLREETAIKAPATGDLNIKLIDGTRVPRGEVVAFINASDSNYSAGESNVQTRLKSLRQEALALQMSYNRVQAEIDAKRIQLKRIPKNSKKAQSMDEDLSLLEQEKASLFRNIQMNCLQTKQLQKKIGNEPGGTVLVSAENPGFFYSRFDGWEGKLSPDFFTRISPADFKRRYSLKSPGKQSRSGEVIGKVVNPFKQVIALLLEPEQTGTPDAGETWWYRSGENTYRCSVWKKLQLENGKILIGLEDTSLPAELMPNRLNKIFLIYHRRSGVSVPVQALYKRGGNTVVKRVKGDGYQEEKVTVLETDGIKAIISGIDFGTTIISR
ncbi:MAG: HlyD family efflux transporter periplasmic adaptor subunit [Bacillota bacterium]